MSKTREQVIQAILISQKCSFTERPGVTVFRDTDEMEIRRDKFFEILDAVYERAFEAGRMTPDDPLGNPSPTLGEILTQAKATMQRRNNWPLVVEYLNLTLYHTGSKQWNHNDMVWCAEYTAKMPDGCYTIYLDMKTAHLREVAAID